MMRIQRGMQRSKKPDVFLSHSSKDKALALRVATDLNFCGVDVWLDDWEMHVGQSLQDEIAKAMEISRYIAILISDNYNQSVWTKTEYKKAVAREQKENRVVMLPLILGGDSVPPFIEDKLYLDLRQNYYSGLIRLAGMVHNLTEFRLSRAISNAPPQSVSDIWRLLKTLNFEPFVVFGSDDFDEILEHGGDLVRDDYARFYPDSLLNNSRVSDHVKSLLREIF